MDGKRRCAFCNMKNPLYVEYHDREWCVPNFDDGYLYEMLILESFQAGLSWECVLNKRASFKEAFEGFDPLRVKDFDCERIDRLMSNKGIIRNRRKIAAAIKNTKIFLKIAEEFGSFYNYLLGFTEGRTFYEVGKTKSELSDALSGDLESRGMTFVGSVIIYSYLQAIGVICSHERECFLFKEKSNK